MSPNQLSYEHSNGIELFFGPYRNGSVMLQLDVDHQNGGMKINDEFLVSHRHCSRVSQH